MEVKGLEESAKEKRRAERLSPRTEAHSIVGAKPSISVRDMP